MLTQHQRATAYLERSENYSPLDAWPEHELVFRVWRYPAFSAYSSWLLHKKDDKHRVRRLEWDRSKPPIGEPVIYGSEAIVAAEQAASIVQQLRSITLPPFGGPAAWGIDGVSYGVEGKGVYASGRLSWWCRPPAGWEALAQWFDAAVEVFDNLLPQSTARMSDRH